MLELKNVSKSFGSKKVLSNFSYSFEEKGIYAIGGKSGIGKTTLLRIIAGLDKDFEGKLFKDFQKISFAFQEHRLFPTLNALENASIALENGADNAICRRILEQMLLSEKDLLLYPKELSGGMRQRISIARAICYDAPVLLLDEPFKELDELTKSRVLELVAKEGKKRLVILVTHDQNDVNRLFAKQIILE